MEIDGLNIYIIHNIYDLNFDPLASGFKVVVSGHSHKPNVEKPLSVKLSLLSVRIPYFDVMSELIFPRNIGQSSFELLTTGSHISV